MGAKRRADKPNRRRNKENERDEEEDIVNVPETRENAKEHVSQLQRLSEKDPEFHEYLETHAKELLEFSGDEDADEDAGTDMDDTKLEHTYSITEKETEPSKQVITNAMVDSWVDLIRENNKVGAVRSVLRAFRVACHYGDMGEDESSLKFSIMSSSVFNKIMVFVLNNMDGILRKLMKLPTSRGKKETVINLMSKKEWKSFGHLVKSYLGNALHILNQMTDTEMIAFTIRRLSFSVVFLAAYPSLLRKYIKVSLHFLGTGGGALPTASLFFLRDLCIQIGSDCLDECFKGIYKAYVMNCQFVNATTLQHIQFLRSCVIELYRVDVPTAYQNAFVFIRQLAMILREAHNMKTKEASKKVYGWKFMNCLELWTGAICAFSSEADFRPLAYPLTQILSGVARLVPTARYFPVRLRCAKMLNRIAASTGTYIPVSLPLLDMLEMKELNHPPTGGIGKAVDLRTVLKVNKPTLKTRGFQEACVFSVVEELAEHLSQWSYSVAFFELVFIPSSRLRSFCKSTKVERFRREMREFIRQIEANSDYTNAKRSTITFVPNDLAATSFLEVEKESGASPLSQYAISLRQRAQQRNDSMVESSVVVGANSSVFGNGKKFDSDEEDDSKDVEKGATVFSSNWLPGPNSKSENSNEKKMKKKKKKRNEEVAVDEDIVGELVLSSDEDESHSDTFSEEGKEEEKPMATNQGSKKRKPSRDLSNKRKSPAKRPKRKKAAK